MAAANTSRLVPICACPQSSAIAILSNVAVVTGGFSADTAEDFDVSKHFTTISIAMSDTGLRSPKINVDSQALEQGTNESKVQFKYSLQQRCTYVQQRPSLLHDAVLEVP